MGNETVASKMKDALRQGNAVSFGLRSPYAPAQLVGGRAGRAGGRKGQAGRKGQPELLHVT